MHKFALLLLLFSFVACSDDGATDDSPTGTPTDAAVDPGADAAVPVSPGVQITSPAEGDVTRARVTINGTFSGGEGGAVTVNGVAAQTNGDTFEAVVTFEVDGAQTLTATYEGATDEVSIVVDLTPPRIDITQPTRAQHVVEGLTEIAFTVTEEVGLAFLALNDFEFAPDGGPDYTVSRQLEHGLNLLVVQAEDLAGRTATEHVSVLHGATADPDALLPSALRIHLGTRALSDLGALASGLLDGMDFAALMPEGFVTGPFTITLDTFTYNLPSIIEMPPAPNHDPPALAFHLRFDNVVIGLGVGITDIGDPTTIGLGAHSVDLTGFLITEIVDGKLEIRLDELDAEFTELALTFGSLPDLNGDPSDPGLVEDIANAVVIYLAETELPPIIAGFLSSLDEPIPLDLLGAQMVLSLVPSVVTVTDLGLSILIDMGVELLNPPAVEPEIPGFLTTPTNWVGVPNTQDLGMAIDDDLINAFLFQLWRTGNLGDELVLLAGDSLDLLKTVLVNVVSRNDDQISAGTPTNLGIGMPLPIVVNVQKAGEGVGLVLGLGSMRLLLNDQASDETLFEGAAALRLAGAIGVEIVPAGMELTLEVGETLTAFDVMTERLRDTESEIETPVNDLLSSLAGALPGLLSGFPLPSLEGVPLSDIRVSAAEADGHFTQITARLIEAEE